MQSEVILWSMLEGAGFKVHFPAGIDGDDAVARLAIKLDAYVLSRDQVSPLSRVFDM